MNGLDAITWCAWVNLTAVASWQRIFDFGTGSTNYMFLTTQYSTASGSNNRLRFAIRTPTVGEQQITSSTASPIGNWAHVAITLANGIGTMYLNGTQVGQNTAMTLNPALLGVTTQNYIGKSKFSADPYLSAGVDDFRIYTAPSRRPKPTRWPPRRRPLHRHHSSPLRAMAKSPSLGRPQPMPLPTLSNAPRSAAARMSPSQQT